MSGHIETIKCPECETVQVAEVLHTYPYWSYVHKCNYCGHSIMESEWNDIKNNEVVK